MSSSSSFLTTSSTESESVRGDGYGESEISESVRDDVYGESEISESVKGGGGYDESETSYMSGGGYDESETSYMSGGGYDESETSYMSGGGYEDFMYGGDDFVNEKRRRTFTVTHIDNEEVDLGEGGRFTVSLKAHPGDAAKKAFSSLRQKLNKNQVIFCIRETTQGSSKKVYGPYIGKRKQLSKPKKVNRIAADGKKKVVSYGHAHHVVLHKEDFQEGGYFYA